MKRLLMLLLVLFFIGCTSEDSARELLKQEGFTNVEVTGFRLFGCSEDDWFRTGFKATKNGKEITGIVCEGVLKGKTIRFD